MGRWPAIVLTLALAACGASEEEERLDRTFEFAVRTLRDVGRNPIAAGAYQSALEGGGTPLSYVVFSAPANADFSDLGYEEPAAPWAVMIRHGAGDTELVVEAYGADKAQPLRSETIDLAPR